MVEFDRTCANCRKHLEDSSIAGFIEGIGNVCEKCWKKLKG